MPIFGGKKDKKSKAITAIEELLDDADKSLKSGDLDKAASEYRRSHRYLYREENIAESPDNYSHLFARTGHGLFETGEPDRAVECFDKATQLNPNNTDAWMSRGIVHMKSGAMLNYAIMCFDEVLKHEPNNIEAMENKVEALVLSKKQDDAAELLEKMIKVAPTNESYKKKLQELSPMDLETVTAKLKKNPKDPGLWRKRAEFLEAAGNTAEAIEAYLRLAYLSKDVEIYRKVLGLNPNNMTAVDKLLEAAPDDVSLLLKKAGSMYSDGKSDEALVLYDRILSIQPDNGEATERVLELRPPEPEPVPEEPTPEPEPESVADEPVTPEPEIILEPEIVIEPVSEEPAAPEPEIAQEPPTAEPEIVLETKEPEPVEIAPEESPADSEPEIIPEESATELEVVVIEPAPPVKSAPADPYQKKIAASPDNPDLYIEAGDYYFENDELGRALECFTKAVELSPTDTVALHNMGSVLFVMQKYDEVVATFDRLIAIDSEDTAAYLTKGAALFKAGKYDESVQALNNVVKRDMNDAAAWYYKASAEAMKGNLKLVVPFLTRS
ncbi:MAG: tetratricopeptide repeat protein, partial [Candidatus Thermoplasmatota archaeon]|nr:tetratricopeptide repeat protein [Candidatus Thermoplasmatota archaeon]